MNVKIDKPFLTVSTQIHKLEEQGLKISNDSYAKDILRTHSYYSFVNGYCDLLTKRRSPRVFKDGASFSELLAIYNFDEALRKVMFPEVLYVEEKVKATCINVFCGFKLDGSLAFKMDDYLHLDCYDVSTDYKKDDAKKLIKDFKRAIKSNIEKKNPAFIHVNDCNSYIPFWVLTTNLSFGQISKFYECLDVRIRRGIAKRYHLEERDLRTTLKILNTARNVCAHNNRLYLAKVPYMFKTSIGLGGCQITIDSNCNHKFGSTLYALKYLISDSRFNNIIQQIGDNLSILKSKLRTIRIVDVLKRMGISPLMVKEFGINIS